MLIKTPGIVSVDHVIWQPEFKCVSNCKGCYLKNSKVTQGITLHTDIIDLIFQQHTVTCSQFTISLDSFYRKPEQLVKTLKDLWSFYETKNPSINLCLTVQNYASLLKWTQAFNMQTLEFLKPVTILSLSSMPNTKSLCQNVLATCRKTNTILNYNKVIFSDVSNDKHFHIGCHYADQVYIVLHKKALGGINSKSMINLWAIAAKIAIRETKGQVIFDQCVLDSMYYKDSKCSAGIRKVAVWPDNTVSGCPYDTEHIVHPNQDKNLFKNLDKIVNTSHCHPMKFCTIPSIVRGFKHGRTTK